MSVENLHQFLTPPAASIELGRREDWPVIEQRIGIKLPQDYTRDKPS